MQYCTKRPATDWIDDKFRMAYILLETNIPAFHHSIIPFPGQIRIPNEFIHYHWVVEIYKRLISYQAIANPG